MGRRLFNLTALVSLLLLVGSTALWSHGHYKKWAFPGAGIGRGPQISWTTESAKCCAIAYERGLGLYRVESSFPLIDTGLDFGWDYMSMGTKVAHDFGPATYQQHWRSEPLPKLFIESGTWFHTSLSGRAPYTQARTILTIPWWLIVTGTSILPLYWLAILRSQRRRQYRLTHGLCIHCGYDLRATPGRCPECGRVPDGRGADIMGGRDEESQ